jgi:uncharacterized membrane protein
MTWSTHFRVREYVRGSLWIVPLLGALLGGLLGSDLLRLEKAVDVPTYWEYSPATASTVLAALVGALAALTGFVITVTVLVVQMATGTLSARYMRLWYRDRMLKVTLAVLVGALTLSLELLRRVEEDFVPNLGVTLAGILVVVGLLLFLLFLDRFIHRLRPVAVAELMARAGREAFAESVRAVAAEGIRVEQSEPDVEPTLVVRSDRAGSTQAVDTGGLVQWARVHGAELVLPHAVGDFVPKGAALVQVFGQQPADAGDVEPDLRGMVALGDERTIQQDPAFAIRILVDIAIRALSPAVNDPTTAVQILDYLEEMLQRIGTTDLAAVPGRQGDRGPGVALRMRRWDDFLALGVTEIRLYGAHSIQVVRRLRAMLEELDDAVLPANRAAVEEELRRLDATVAEAWGGSVDLDRASVAGRQGIGGPAAGKRSEDP